MSESTTTVIGYQDLPVDNLKDDLFNVESYVNGLCLFILNCDTPMTISIQGDWGSGKTSMMNMVKEHLGEKILPIWFNTWQFSQFQLDGSIAISMIDILLKKLDDNTKDFQEISDRVINLMKLIAIITTEKAIGSLTASKVGQALNNEYSLNFIDEISSLKEQFQEAVNNKLKTNAYDRVVVFIDDLDRLQPLKAIELLEVLKLFLDCKNCVFVLAIDYEVVTLGIRQKYGSDIDAAKGKSFFDKIIQLPFKMPVAQYDIKKYTKSMMEKMNVVDKTEDNTQLFSSLIKTSIGLNPRGMKRLFNAYQLLYNIIQPKETITNVFDKIKKKEINMLKQKILFAVVCMQMSFDAVYDYLSDGNVSIDTLNNLKAIDDRTINIFLKQKIISSTTKSDTLDDELIEDNILNAIFDNKTSVEELSIVLQKLPNFIKHFLKAIHTSNSSDELSEEEVKYLRDILKHSAITSVNTLPPNEQAIERKEKNINLAQKINALLIDIGEFKISQAKSANNGIISSAVSGYFIFTGKDNKEFQLRYVLDYAEKGITISIYLKGQNQNPEEFYNFMGENPLNYSKKPLMNAKPGWYFYVDIFNVNDDEKSSIQYIAEKVEDAYNRLIEYIENKMH